MSLTFNQLVEAAEPIWMYHGGRWTGGQIELRPPKKGRYESGPGLYLTTSYQRARKYAKGGGGVVLVELEPSLRWADRVLVPVAAAVGFVQGLPRVPKRDKIVADLRANAARRGIGMVSAEVLINLFVNYEAGSGDAGVALARWLVAAGVDATYQRAQVGEDWAVVLNPAVVRSARVVAAKDVAPDMYDLPPVAR